MGNVDGFQLEQSTFMFSLSSYFAAQVTSVVAIVQSSRILSIPFSVVQAVEVMNGATLNGRIIYCSRAQKRKERMMELQRKYEADRMERYSK